MENKTIKLNIIINKENEENLYQSLDDNKFVISWELPITKEIERLKSENFAFEELIKTQDDEIEKLRNLQDDLVVECENLHILRAQLVEITKLLNDTHIVEPCAMYLKKRILHILGEDNDE